MRKTTLLGSLEQVIGAKEESNMSSTMSGEDRYTDAPPEIADEVRNSEVIPDDFPAPEEKGAKTDNYEQAGSQRLPMVSASWPWVPDENQLCSAVVRGKQIS